MENLQTQMEVRDIITDMIDLIDFSEISNQEKIDTIQDALNRLEIFKNSLVYENSKIKRIGRN